MPLSFLFFFFVRRRTKIPLFIQIYRYNLIKLKKNYLKYFQLFWFIRCNNINFYTWQSDKYLKLFLRLKKNAIANECLWCIGMKDYIISYFQIIFTVFQKWPKRIMKLSSWRRWIFFSGSEDKPHNSLFRFVNNVSVYLLIFIERIYIS